jgi:glutamine amidotransferase-like uncharacterized protein
MTRVQQKGVTARGACLALLVLVLVAIGALGGCEPVHSAVPATEASDSSTTGSVEPTAPSAPASSAVVPAAPSGGARVALIYNGKVAAEGAPEALAELAESQGMKVAYFDTPAKLPAMLQGATFCMIGGTEDDLTPLLKQFTPPVRAALTAWLSEGGVYVGICGGGYVASQGWEESYGFVEALGITPVVSEAWIEEADPRIITVKWNGANRAIYYQYGPAFLVTSPSDGEVIARYDDGKVAALATDLGKGRVVVWGPHPEADVTWLDDDPAPVHAGRWKPTRDIAIAMLQGLLPTGGPLP